MTTIATLRCGNLLAYVRSKLDSRFEKSERDCKKRDNRARPYSSAADNVLSLYSPRAFEPLSSHTRTIRSPNWFCLCDFAASNITTTTTALPLPPPLPLPPLVYTIIGIDAIDFMDTITSTNVYRMLFLSQPLHDFAPFEMHRTYTYGRLRHQHTEARRRPKVE